MCIANILIRRKHMFWQHENPMVCAVTHVLALAFHDGAFAATSLTRAAQISKLRVPRGQNAVHLSWRRDVLEKPIFRQLMRKDGISQTSHWQPLLYEMAAQRLNRLGTEVGIAEKLTKYTIRRASGNAVRSKSISILREAHGG